MVDGLKNLAMHQGVNTRIAQGGLKKQSLDVTFLQSYTCIDATLFGPFMREFGLGIGVQRTEGKVVDVRQDPESGDVTTLVLEDGREMLSADVRTKSLPAAAASVMVAIASDAVRASDSADRLAASVSVDTESAAVRAFAAASRPASAVCSARWASATPST